MNEVDKILRIISVDLMEPAINLRNASDLLQTRSHDWDREKLNMYYSQMHKAAKGQIELLKSLKIWTQTLTGRYYFSPVSFDIDHFLFPVIEKATEFAEAKGVELELNVPEYMCVRGDIEIVCTVVGHLLSNAVKFTAKGGKVTLSTSVSDDELRPVCTVSVTDTGVGMSAAHVAKLYSLDDSSLRVDTDKEVGNGMGLIVCRELLKLHGSELNVESEEGKGSRFWFEFDCK